MEERIIINDYIENDPLSENNLDKTLDLADKIRLSSPQKTIWLYTGYTIYFSECCNKKVLSAKTDEHTLDATIPTALREKILEGCDIVVDGQYIESKHDVSLPYRGSSNQRLIDIQQTLQKGKIVLWQT